MYNTVASDNKKQDIYLDYAALAPVDPVVLEKMRPYFGSEYGNASSLHSSGRRSRQVIEHYRKNIANILSVDPREIIFTSGGTESDNLAILGIARAHKQHGNHIIMSAIEHKAVLSTRGILESEGFVVDILPVDKHGMIDIKQCIDLVKSETILVSVMYVNNEIGTIEPIKKISQSIKNKFSIGYPLIHTDACQAPNLLSVSARDLGVDLMSLNSSKVYGPSGIGLLYKRSLVKIQPLQLGGEQEHNLRAGTESVALIAGFAEALSLANSTYLQEWKRLQVLQTFFKKELKRRIPSIIFNGHPKMSVPSIVHVSIPYIEGESMLLLLDSYGIQVSTGSAFSAFDLLPSHVLSAIGQEPEIMHGSIRFSLGRHTTKADLEYVLEIFPKIVEYLKNISALTIKK
ncbi:MAG: cysteine desulfurase family protein [bacterium]